MNKQLIESLSDYLVENRKAYQASLQADHGKDRVLKENVSLSTGIPTKLPAEPFLKKDHPVFLSFHDEAGNRNCHYHDFFEINYVLEGNPIGVVNNQEVVLKTGSLCIMNPNAVHYFKEYKDGRDLILNIVLPKKTFKKHIFTPLLTNPTMNAFFVRFQMDNQGNPSYIFLENPDPSVTLLIEMLVKEYLELKPYNSAIMESLITLIFSYILRNYGAAGKNTDTTMESIMDYIYENYSSCSLQVMAEKFNYHPKYLSALIKKYTGQPFRTLITDIKMQNAIQYMMYTDWRIEKIAEIIGYQEKSSFYLNFRKVYGQSPAAYRDERKG